MVIILHLNEMKYVVITRLSRSLLWVKTIVDHRTCILGKPLKNHQCQWSIWEKNIQWWWSGCSKTIEKPSKAMVLRKKNITIPSFEKNDHRWSLCGSQAVGENWERSVRIVTTSLSSAEQLWTHADKSHGFFAQRPTQKSNKAAAPSLTPWWLGCWVPGTRPTRRLNNNNCNWSNQHCPAWKSLEFLQ